MKDNNIKVLITDPLSDAGLSVLKNANISIVYNTDVEIILSKSKSNPAGILISN